MKNYKNVRKEKLKSNKGAISLLVAITIFTFMAVLTGTFITISILRRSQADSNAKIKSVYEKDYERVDEIYDELTSNMRIKNGSWNGAKKVNTPQSSGTGLIPVYWENDGTLVELSDDSTDVQWNKWYDYDQNKWANAITKDKYGNITGYFVWIPRFAYKITSNVGIGGENIAGSIDIKFIKTSNNVDLEYPDVENNAMEDYVVHPAFTSEVDNGGWDTDIPGFWISKFPAGLQANTVEINNDTFYKVNGLDEIRTNANGIAYPVFKPLTYTYNMISVGDSYTISRNITDGSDSAIKMYNLSNIDSHLEKNSEWGAVAYLTLSKYGRNGNKININNFYIDSNVSNNIIITGVYANGTNNNATTNITDVKAYNTDVGKNGSSTANIYGVYDLNGCVFERVAAYITNDNANLTNYGLSFTTEGTNKYVTAYPMGYQAYASLRTENYEEYGFGDSILETSHSGTGNTSWNADFSIYPSESNPFFTRGGSYTNKGSVNSFNKTDGNAANDNGFRVVLIANQSNN